MPNISSNRINTVLPVTDVTTIIADLKNILNLLPSHALTPNEMKKMKGVSAANKIFTEDCIIHLKINGADCMPPFIKTEELINDFELNKQLHVLESMVDHVKSRIEMLKRITSKEEYEVAKTVYECYGNAADAGVPGAKASYEHLKERFKKHSGRNADKSIKKS